MSFEIWRAQRAPGEPVRVERVQIDHPIRAAMTAVSWWGQPACLAVAVVEVDGEKRRITEHYTRPGFEVADLEGWPQPSASAAPLVREQRQAAPLFEEEEVTAVSPVREPTSGCACCGAPAESRDPAERDRSPSGRLADLRCPECGVPSKLGTVALWGLYQAHQRRLSAAHEQLHKPWNPR